MRKERANKLKLLNLELYKELYRRSKTNYSKNQPNMSLASSIVSRYKNIDKRKGLLSICDFTSRWMADNIIGKSCFYCGDLSSGCDRIDNSIGHIKSNCVPCCHRCNTIRNNIFTPDEMKILGPIAKKIIDDRIKIIDIENK